MKVDLNQPKTGAVVPSISENLADAKRSGVSYPYFDLASSIKVAEVIYTRGGGTCSQDQLVAWLDYKSVKSGTYLTRVAAARNFGLVRANIGRIAVTDRAMRIIAPVMPEDAISAKVEAFLSVELFSKVYEQFRGKQLPPEAGLKNLFKSPPYSILADRIDPAVRVFLNSAGQAGFFEASGDRSRLIPPSTTAAPSDRVTVPENTAPQTPLPPQKSFGGVGGSSGDGTAGVHSAIVGLLRELPPPGTPWPTSKKQRFLSAFQHTIDFIYPSEDVT